MKPNLYIVESRRFDQDVHRRELESRNFFGDICVFHNVLETMEYLQQKKKRGRPPGSIKTRAETFDCVCLVGQTVLKLLEMLEEAARHRTRVRFFLVCGRPCHGCAFVTDKHSIHGCASSDDTFTEIIDGLCAVSSGKIFISNSMNSYLEECPHRSTLGSLSENRHIPLYRLTAKHWSCLRCLLQGMTDAKMANALQIAHKSALHLKYRLFARAEVSGWPSMLQKSFEWGLLEHPEIRVEGVSN